jgi:sugar phosphate isomerase/epimerase
MTKPILGLQLYSLRREFEADAEGTFRSVRGLGYEYVETAGDYGWSAEKWKELLQETGLKVAGAHVGGDSLTKDLAKTVEFQKALGNHRYIIGYVPEHTAEGFAKAAAMMNKAAEQLRSEGGEVFYHNHDFEFKPISGTTTGYDILLKETDPKLVRFEVDTYWVEKGGHDAAEFVTKHADRIGIIHAKELRRSDKSDQAIGEGDIDFAPIVALAKTRDWPLIVEFEGEEAVTACRKSAASLSRLINT